MQLIGNNDSKNHDNNDNNDNIDNDKNCAIFNSYFKTKIKQYNY